MNNCKFCSVLIHGWEDMCDMCADRVSKTEQKAIQNHLDNLKDMIKKADAEDEEERIALNDHYARQAGAKDRQEGGNHYTDMGVGPWDVIDTWPFEQQVGFYRGNALKYLMRMGTKNDDDLQEARKAAHYTERLIEILKGF